jgi:hypothetical protein
MRNRKAPNKAQLSRAREKWMAISKANTAWRAIERADDALQAAFSVPAKYRRTVVDRLRSCAAKKKARVKSVVSLASRLRA